MPSRPHPKEEREDDPAYDEDQWSWFYKKFILETVHDGHYTAPELIKKNKKIISKVEKLKIRKNHSRSSCEEVPEC